MSVLCSRRSVRAFTLILCCTFVINALNADAFECGKPLGPCGEQVPAGTKCPKGAGWCAAGHYCGYAKGVSKAKCVPLPKNCGKAGNACCPSNAKTPHTSTTGALERTPFCTDGSTCYFDPSLRFTSYTPDPYAGVPGTACLAIPVNCGTTPNSPCCPDTYKVAYNPPLKRAKCPENFWCEFDEENGPKYPGSALMAMPTGRCQRNAPDCGTVGKPCCVIDGGCCRANTCTPAGGKKGYCAAADGRTEGVKEKDLICRLCPAAGGSAPPIWLPKESERVMILSKARPAVEAD